MLERACWLLIALLMGCGTADAPAEETRAPGGAGTGALTAPTPDRGALHIVRMVARGDQYAFEPAELTVRSGDVVRFVHTGNQPEAVAFDSAAAPPGGADFLNRHGYVRGPLLTEPGAFFDVTFRDAPPGEYRFFSVPHGQLGMQGRVILAEPPQ